MKKTLLYLICLLLAVLALGSCDIVLPEITNQVSESTNSASPKPTNSALPETESPKPSDTSPEPALLSVDEANEIYNAWLVEHDELSSFTLDTQSYQMFELLGEQYYRFNTTEAISYWYNILIHTKTGELLFMMNSDGENPTTSIEPLEDWYNSAYGE